MKVSEFKKQLARLVNPKNQTIPALETILFKDGWMTTTDLQTTTKVKVPFSGEFTTDYKNLKKIVSKLPKNLTVRFYGKTSIEVKKDDDGKEFEHELFEIFLSCGKANIQLGYSKVDEFPGTYGNLDEYECIGKFDDTDIAKLKKAVKFASKDELRPVLMTVHINGELGEYVSTTAHCLWRDTEGSRFSEKMNICKTTIPYLEVGDVYIRKVKEEDGTYAANQYAVKNDSFICITREVEGNYPQYLSVYPNTNETLTFNRKELLECLEIMKTLDVNYVGMFADSPIKGYHYKEEKMEYDLIIPIKPKVFFDLDFILTLLKEIEEDDITVHYVNGGDGALNQGVMFNNHLLMPYMLFN